MITGIDPLRVLIYKDGLVRLATLKYKKPTNKNIEKLFMHLTNYSVNKKSDKFEENEVDENDEETGFKRSIKWLFNKLEDEGKDCTKLWKKIKKIVIKTLCAGQPYL